MNPEPDAYSPSPLTRPLIAFLRGIVVNKPSRRRSQGLAGQLASSWGIGRPDAYDPGYVVYVDADYKRAEAALGQGGIPLPAPPAQEPKRTPLRNEEGYVAAAPMNMGPPAWPGAHCFTMSARDAIKLNFEAILMVERFEVLLQLGAYGWLPSFVRGRRTLALFQGGRGHFLPGPARFVVERSTVPVLVFFDFDPSSLLRAAEVPRLEALCLPAWQDLEPALHRHKRNNTFPSEFASHSAGLDASDCSVVSPVWARMKAVRRGLNQDQFPR